MNKTELIATIAERTELSKKNAEKALNTFLDVVVEELKKGEKIQLVGFGTFEAAKVAERKGIIQMGERKGQEYVTSAHCSPKFKPGKSLKDAVK